MFHLHGKAERCQALPSLLKDVLFSVYKGKLFFLQLIHWLMFLTQSSVLVDHDL